MSLGLSEDCERCTLAINERVVHRLKRLVPLPELFVVFVFCVQMLSQATWRAADLLTGGVRATPATRHG